MHTNKTDSAFESINKHEKLNEAYAKFLQISWAELNTFFLKIYEDRIKKLTPADLLKNYETNKFLKISDADPRKINKIENLLFDIVHPIYKIIDISPISPIGINTVLAKINSKTSLSTIRNLEVLGDPTTQLALETVKIKRANPSIDVVKLATSCRLLRTQNFDSKLGMSNHFKAFALTAAGRNIGNRIFEFNTLQEHLISWLDFFNKSKELGSKIKDIHVAISNISIINELCEKGLIDKKDVVESIRYNKTSAFIKNSINLTREIENILNIPHHEYPFLKDAIEMLKRAEIGFIQELRQKYPNVKFYYRLDRIAGSTFYTGLCYKIYATTKDNVKHALVDGGVSNWNKQLLQNNKEMIFTSGFGTELFSKFFL